MSQDKNHDKNWETLEHITQDQLNALTDLHDRYLKGRIGGRRIFLKSTNLSGLSIAGRNLRQAQFMNCLMREMDLSKIDFAEGALYACDLSDSNLSGASFVRADLRGTRIENANLKDADLEKADLRVGSISSADGSVSKSNVVDFSGANLAGAKLVGSMASRANFTDANMSGSNMSRADMRGAKLSGADLSGAQIKGAQMEGADLKSAILTGIEADDLTAAHMDISCAITDANIGQSIMEMEEPITEMVTSHRLWIDSAGEKGTQMDISGVDMRFLKTLEGEKMTAIRAAGAKFFGMNLSNVEMQSASLDGSDFRNCTMDGADLRGSSLKGCNLSHASLQKMNGSPLLFGGGRTTKNFNPCDFDGAVLRYANFTDASLKNASFRGADLSYADLSNADLRDADFTGAIMHETNTGGAQTQGAQMGQLGGRAFRLQALSKDDK